jgi:GT2 family glycosyltransferase
MTAAAPLTAIVTAFKRVDQTLSTIETLRASDPPPAEIRVHVDAGGDDCAAAIRRTFPDVHVTLSDVQVGPGGGRNRLIGDSHHDIVASFDDDAYPMDRDYFARVLELFTRYPDASLITARVYHPGEPVEPAQDASHWAADFSGGACAYRKSAFAKLGGYVPIPLAYGMEEVDLALRLHAIGGRVLQTEWMRVFHDTDRGRHAEPQVTAATISNLALLAYLRYPIWLWGIGVVQCANRILWLLRHGRHRGIVAGVMQIPSELWRYRRFVDRVPAHVVRSYFTLRRSGHV